MNRIPPAGWVIIGVLVFTLLGGIYMITTATNSGFTPP